MVHHRRWILCCCFFLPLLFVGISVLPHSAEGQLLRGKLRRELMPGTYIVVVPGKKPITVELPNDAEIIQCTMPGSQGIYHEGARADRKGVHCGGGVKQFIDDRGNMRKECGDCGKKW
jgi:hypothetical protein